MNIGTFIGRIGRNATVRQVGDTDATSFPVAVDVGYGDKKTTLWLDCTLWGVRGPKIADYIVKGDRIGVTGEIGTRTWDKDGETQTSVTLRVSDVTLLGEKREREETPQRGGGPVQRRGEQPQRRQAPARETDGFEDESTPFVTNRGNW